jgi:hypothetical protein
MLVRFEANLTMEVVFMPSVGDQIELKSNKVGQDARRGTVTKIGGSMLTVRWSSGGESVFVPAAGSLTVIAQRAAASSRKKKR